MFLQGAKQAGDTNFMTVSIKNTPPGLLNYSWPHFGDSCLSVALGAQANCRDLPPQVLGKTALSAGENFTISINI